MRRQQGSVFVVTVAVLAGLVALIAGIAASNGVEHQAQLNRMQQQRAELMAETGIQYAISQVQKEKPGFTSTSEDWYAAGSGGATMNLVGTDGFRIQIFDSTSKINLNVATQDQLKKLPLTDEQIDCLLDWRENKPSPRALGAKDDYYGALTHPYKTKQQPFDSVDELLNVKGFTPQSLYGGAQSGLTPYAGSPSSSSAPLYDMLTVDSLSKDKDAKGNTKVDLNTVNMAQLVSLGVPSQTAQDIQSRIGSFQSMGDVMLISSMNKTAAHVILDNFTVGGVSQKQGRINANTASQATLETIPGLNSDVAQAIVTGQSAGYKTMGDLVEVPGMDFQTLAKSLPFLCIGSSNFEVRVMGVAGSTAVAMEAFIVLGDDGTVQVSRIRPVSYWSVRNRWGWSLSTTGSVQLGVKS